MSIVTVIAGFQNEDVLPFVARAPLVFSDEVVFVDGIRPIIKRSNPRISWDTHFEYPFSRDNTQRVCLELGIKYINPQKALYNGEKINIGAEFLKKRVHYETLVYLEADEAIEPADMRNFVEYIKLYRYKKKFLAFNLWELWKDFTAFEKGIHCSCSKIINGKFKFPVDDEGHNCREARFESCENRIPDVRFYHLHMFREKALHRVENGKWRGGGDGGGINIEEVKFDLKKTPFLEEIYSTLKIQERNISINDPNNTYVGIV